MRGILLAGGLGTRLHPLTRVTNKHLLPIHDRPMIHYPIQSMKDSGIEEILLVTGGNHAEDFVRVLGNGEELGVDLWYRYQDEPKGIAHALKLCRKWAGDEPICVMLGDNILSESFAAELDEFREKPCGARMFSTTVEHPERYGVVYYNANGGLISVVEKPATPFSNEIAIGLYFYDTKVWKVLDTLGPSKRGELEITDVNNYYIKNGLMKVNPVRGWWADAGESLDVYADVSCRAAHMFGGCS